MKLNKKDLSNPFDFSDELERKSGCSVFAINARKGSFEPLFASNSQKEAQTILNKLCDMCEEDCPDIKKRFNACYRIIDHDKN